MPEQILDYKASEPASTSSSTFIFLPVSPGNAPLADLGLFLTPPTPAQNRVELKATVGLASNTRFTVVLFRIFRDGSPIFSSQQGVGPFELQYNVTLQTIDFNVSSGFHTYTLTAEVLTGSASVLGPIVFSGLAIGPIE